MSKQIKVIKKSAQPKEVAVSNSVKMNEVKQKAISTKSAAREMASTVSSWVNEFQQKRREETTNALKQLFREQPQPTGA
jgi:hypothetical protein